MKIYPVSFKQLPVKRPFLLMMAVIMVLLVAFPLCPEFPNFKKVADSQSYISMAQGQSQGVLLHHAKRILHPLVVGKLAGLLGIDVAFLLVGLFSLGLFFYTNLNILCHENAYPFFFIVPLIFLPCLYQLFYELYLPTLFYLGLSSVFWLLLIKRHYFLSLPVLFLLYLVRDETLLLAIILVFILSIKRPTDVKKRSAIALVAAIIFVSGLGIFLAMHATRSNSNLHKMPGVVFSLVRMPLFYFSNFTGFVHWVDTYKTLDIYKHKPLWVIEAPSIVRRLSIIRQIGIYEWNPRYILNTLLYYLSIFGTGITILYFYRKRIFAELKSTFSGRVAIFFGLTILTLAPALGPPNLRYYINAWPLFVFILPWLLKDLSRSHPREYQQVTISYILSILLYFSYFRTFGIVWALIFLALEIVLHVYTWSRLKGTGHYLGMSGFKIAGPLNPLTGKPTAA